MEKNTKSRKTINLPEIEACSAPSPKLPALPFNGIATTEGGFSISFACFDRFHELFNLGDSSSEDGTITGAWFLDFLDCLKEVTNKKYYELKHTMHKLHPVDWKNANTKRPACSEQIEFDQFRISKSKGRVVGFYTQNVFYIVWLDPHHNLSDSEGYGTVTYYSTPQSEYDQIQAERDFYKMEAERYANDLSAANELLGLF